MHNVQQPKQPVYLHALNYIIKHHHSTMNNLDFSHQNSAYYVILAIPWT